MKKELEKVFGKARDMIIAEIVKQVGVRPGRGRTPVPFRNCLR